MTLFPAIPITDSTPFTFQRNVNGRVYGVIKHLVAWVDSGSGTVFCGNVPDSALDILSLTITSGTNKIGRLAAHHPESVFRAVKLGSIWTCADNAADDGNFVTGIDDNLIAFRNNFTFSASGATGTFTPAAVSSTNGFPILEGTERQWVASRDNDFLGRPIRFVVASGITATLRLAYED